MNSDGYGGDAFRSLTKLKSTVVLELLEEGYFVVWSDVDITWPSRASQDSHG